MDAPGQAVDVVRQNVERAAPESITLAGQLDDVLEQLDEVLLRADLSTPAQVLDLDLRVQVMQDMAKRLKASEHAQRRLGIAHVRLIRRLGSFIKESADWVKAAEMAGITKNLAARARGLASWDDETFEQALEDVAAACIPTIDGVNKRCRAYLSPERDWKAEDARYRDRYWGRDREWGSFDEEFAVGLLGDDFDDQLITEVGRALGEGEPITLRELAERCLCGDPELIVGLDPPGVEVMRKRLRRLARRRDRQGGGWPYIFTVPQWGGRQRFTYVTFEHATVANVLADLDVKKENVRRVLGSFLRLRRLARQLKGHPDNALLIQIVGDQGHDEPEQELPEAVGQ